MEVVLFHDAIGSITLYDVTWDLKISAMVTLYEVTWLTRS